MAVAWTVTQTIGVGVAAPSEQTVSRAVASSVGGQLVTRVRRRLLWATSACLVVPVAGLLGLDPVFGGNQLWAWSLFLGAAGYALVAPSRGELAGMQQFGAYATCVWAEALGRVGLVVLAWAWRAASEFLLAAAIWAPVFGAALVAHLLVRARRAPETSVSAAADVAESLSHQGRFTVVALAGQVSLGFGSVWLQASYPDSGLAGEYVTATTYMRIPIVLVGGLVVVVLASAAAAYAGGRFDAVTAIVSRAVGATALFGPLATGFLLAVSGPALMIFYGQQLSLGWPTMAAMACGTVAAVLGGVVTQSAFACGMSRLAAVVWTTAAAVTVGWSMLSGDSPFELAVATLVGQGLATLALGVRLVLGLRSRTGG
jgi:O-antigen/teichoic acid export membrane protein